LAFGHQDPTIRHQAIVAFGNIKEHTTRSHEVFELCDNGVPFKSIDGKHSSKNGFDMYTATDEAGQKFEKEWSILERQCFFCCILDAADPSHTGQLP
jgi:hypothetical protein